MNEMNEVQQDRQDMTRRTFVRTAAGGAAAALAGCQTGGAVPTPKSDLIAAELIHLGQNMFLFPETPPKSVHVVPSNIKSPAVAAGIEEYYTYREYMRFEEPTWHEVAAHFRARGVNMIVIDMGEGVNWR